MFRLTGQSEWEERLMSLVDIDGNGNIDFKEFTVGMGILGAPPDPYLASRDPPATRRVAKTEDPEERTHADVLRFCANSPRFADFVFQMLDAGGRGVVPRHEILSVTLRFARYVETRVLREFRRDLRVDRRRRRHALSSAARDAAERAVLAALERDRLGEMDEGEDDATTTTSYGYGSSWDSDDETYDDDSDDSSGASADDRTEARGSEGRSRRGDGSTTDAGSEADEETLRLERERRISVVVKGVARTCVREEHDARFHAPAHAAYRPAGDVGSDFWKSGKGADAGGARAVAEELDRLIAWHEAEAEAESEAFSKRDVADDAESNAESNAESRFHQIPFAEIRRTATARRRATVAAARALVADASARLFSEHAALIAPAAFRAFVAAFPEPFAPALEMFRTFEHYLRPAADVVKAVPALRLDVLRARRSAQTWREEQEPAWFFVEPPQARETRPRPGLASSVDAARENRETAARLGKRAGEGPSLEAILEADIDVELGRARRETPRDEKDPAVLAELCLLGAAKGADRAAGPAAARHSRVTASQRDSGAFRVSGVSADGTRASTREALMDAAERRRNAVSRLGGRDDKPAAAEVADNTASVAFGLDGEERSFARRPVGPRALGRAHAVALTAQMRVRDLRNLSRCAPTDAVSALAEVSLRARLVALRTLAPADAARVLAAMAPSLARAELEAGLDPETVGLASRLDALERAPTPEEQPFPREDGAAGSTDFRAPPPRGRLAGFADAFAAPNDSRRAALETLDDSETYVYMGDVENEGGWTRDDGAATNGSDEFV